ncbi:hypothetical protein AJ87_05510 [Rhizobium yanglingense]|nr:hypothetical protein AJ87_05510 [Rhizobium yanglingense]
MDQYSEQLSGIFSRLRTRRAVQCSAVWPKARPASATSRSRSTWLSRASDSADRNMHAEVGFHDGWGTVIEQLARQVENRA